MSRLQTTMQHEIQSLVKLLERSQNCPINVLTWQDRSVVVIPSGTKVEGHVVQHFAHKSAHNYDVTSTSILASSWYTVSRNDYKDNVPRDERNPSSPRGDTAAAVPSLSPCQEEAEKRSHDVTCPSLLSGQCNLTSTSAL